MDAIATMDMGRQLLTEEERALVKLLAETFNLFCQLKEMHPSHAREFEQAIHRAQHIIMIRPIIREESLFYYHHDYHISVKDSEE